MIVIATIAVTARPERKNQQDHVMMMVCASLLHLPLLPSSPSSYALLFR